MGLGVGVPQGGFRGRGGQAVERLRAIWPGLLVCCVVALAATFLAGRLGGPLLLYALLLGLSLHFLSLDQKVKPGVDFCARQVLRVGVALLGARITFDHVLTLGWQTALVVAGAVLTTVVSGWMLARWLGRPAEEGLISGGSVGICGASAALAVASVLPATKDNERYTLMVIVGVTLLSTVAMVVYPTLLDVWAWSPINAGIFLGGTIHDVAQVVASASLLAHGHDPRAVDTATVVKLFRVMMLLPIVLGLSVLYRQVSAAAGTGGERPPLIPGFLIAFIVLMTLASLHLMPSSWTAMASDGSRAMLVLAIAAAGIKTSFADLAKLGWVPVLMLLGETVLIAAIVALSYPFWRVLPA